MASDAKPKGSIREPSVIVKPLGRFGGLDGIHLALMVLVVIMAVLLLSVTYNTNTNLLVTVPVQLSCTYGSVNGTCFVPLHNESQVRLAAENFLASYALVNSSFSLLPYISVVNKMNITYSAALRDWYVTIPELNPGAPVNTTFYLQLTVNDRNGSVTSFIQALNPSKPTSNYVQSYGVVSLADKSACSVTAPVQMYWFIDPYSPGSVKSVVQLASLEAKLGSKIAPRLEILYTQSSQQVAAYYGLNNTILFGEYLFCSSEQKNFTRFADTVNATYNGKFMSPSNLAQLAQVSGLNQGALGSCISTSGSIINRQAILSSYYNVTSSPLVVTDCQYQSIPQTVSSSLCIANSTLC